MPANPWWDNLSLVAQGIGRGILTLRVTRGRLEVDDECMTSDVCAAVVKQAIDEASWNTKVSNAHTNTEKLSDHE